MLSGTKRTPSEALGNTLRRHPDIRSSDVILSINSNFFRVSCDNIIAALRVVGMTLANVREIFCKKKIRLSNTPSEEVRSVDLFPHHIRFLGDGESMPYKEVVEFRSVILLPWDHALMTFYELYSMAIPLLLPKEEWIYRFIYQRGQLSVGEPLYQSVHPRWKRPRAAFGDESALQQESDGGVVQATDANGKVMSQEERESGHSYGPMTVERGLTSAKAARVGNVE